MELQYANRSLEKTLTSKVLIQKTYGTIYRNLINRLAELEAAICLMDISHKPPPRRHKLSGKWEGCWGIDLSRNYRLIIMPQGDFCPEDLKTVTCIEVVGIEDYH